MQQILISPHITEKSFDKAAKGEYTFIVARQANKFQIAKAIEDEFKVHVVDITTVVMKAKTTRTGKKRLLTAPGQSWKKATVTLKDKETIGLFAVEQPNKT